MNLVEDYLDAVARLLPNAQRDDIVAELRDIILSRLEAREGELGRPLTEAETEAVLREVGHPLVVAARYREGPQQLVGPALYPFWMFAVKVAVTLQVGIAATVGLVRALVTGDAAQAFGQAFHSAFTGSVMMIGFATLAAWLFERHGLAKGRFDRWRVRDLRLLRFASWGIDDWRDQWTAPVGRAPGSGSAAKPAKSGEGLTGLVALVVFLLWWFGAVSFGASGDLTDLRSLGIDPGPLSALDLGQIKALVFWPVIALVAVGAVHSALLIVAPLAARWRGVANVGLGILETGLAAWFWLYSPAAPFLRAGSLEELLLRTQEGFEQGPPWPLTPLLSLGVLMIAAGGVCRALYGLWQAVGPRRGETPRATAAVQLGG